MHPIDAGSFLSETRAGRCAEGACVYFPYFDTSSLGCYYAAGSRRLVASAQHEAPLIECGKDGTASHTLARGEYPPCTQITWDASNRL